jgi:hypothetical protein
LYEPLQHWALNNAPAEFWLVEVSLDGLVIVVETCVPAEAPPGLTQVILAASTAFGVTKAEITGKAITVAIPILRIASRLDTPARFD